MSVTSFLGIARSAMLAHQQAMDVTAHNIANAQTPGYSRQRLNLTAVAPQVLPSGTIGRGVTTDGIQRARSEFYDATYRRENGLLGNSGTLASILGQVESAFGEPSDTGLAAALDNLFGAFSDLAADPSNPVVRDAVVQKAQGLISQFHRIDSELTRTAQDAAVQLNADVAQANRLAGQIATLNSRIQELGNSADYTPDLQDQRDQAIDELSALVGVRVLPRDDGTISILAGNTLLVDANRVQTLAVTGLPGGGYGVTADGGLMDPQAGSLKALTDFTTTTLPGIRSQLDQLANALVTEVNTIHRTGTTAGGATNTDFFDPAGVSAGTIRLAPAIAASSSAIAAGTSGAPGDGSVAEALGQLAAAPVGSLGGTAMRDFYTNLTSAVGSAVNDAGNNRDIQQALVDRSALERSSVAGVSIDEEMTVLIGQQHAYAAAARLVAVADEMVQELMKLI